MGAALNFGLLPSLNPMACSLDVKTSLAMSSLHVLYILKGPHGF